MDCGSDFVIFLHFHEVVNRFGFVVVRILGF